MTSKVIFKVGTAAAMFIGRPAVMVTGALTGALPVVLAVGAVVGAAVAADHLLSSNEQDSKLPQKV